MSTGEFGQLLIVGTDRKKKEKAPIGSYDSTILCSSCDNKIGQYDKYALIFVNSVKLDKHPLGIGWQAKDVDTHKLKLFCMSYLWRASITQRKEFEGINLGEKHEECLRQMIFDDNEGSPDIYTVIFAKFTSQTGKDAGIIFPAKTRIRDLVFYEGYLPNLYKFWIKVDSRADEVLSNVSLGAQPEVYIHDKGDFDTSIEKTIMVRAVHNSQ